jgi:hypothetical protein
MLAVMGWGEVMGSVLSPLSSGRYKYCSKIKRNTRHRRLTLRDFRLRDDGRGGFATARDANHTSITALLLALTVPFAENNSRKPKERCKFLGCDGQISTLTVRTRRGFAVEHLDGPTVGRSQLSLDLVSRSQIFHAGEVGKRIFRCVDSSSALLLPGSAIVRGKAVRFRDPKIAVRIGKM